MVGILYFKNHKYFKTLIITGSQCVHTKLPPKLHFNILCPSSNGGSIPNLPLFASNPHNSNQTIMGFPPMVSSANSIPKSPEAPSKAATLATPPLAAAQPSLPPLPLIAPTSAAPAIQRPPRPHPAGGQTASRKSTTSSPSRTSPNSNSNSANNFELYRHIE